MSISTPDHFPRLIADIGGTNARFALETAPRQFANIQVLPAAEHPTFTAAVESYLRLVGEPPIHHAAIAIANPVIGDQIRMTNHHWAFSIKQVRNTLNLHTLLFLNDFTAQAMSIPETPNAQLIQIGGLDPIPNSPKAVIGPGTGLGVSGLIPNGKSYIPLSGEGGHVSFAPQNDTELMVWQYAHEQFGHVSAERLISGAGLALIYRALAQHRPEEPAELSPAEISEALHKGTSATARQSVDVFCSALGTVAADLALTLGARGGVYLCGGIIPRIIDYFQRSPFRTSFNNKGRFSEYLTEIPVFAVLSRYPGLIGASAALEDHLNHHA